MRMFVVELGTGVDLHGQDATSAAVKAIRNAFAHVSLTGLRAVGGLGDLSEMEVEVVLGAPEQAGPVDAAQVAAAFPYGSVRVSVKPGGLLAPGGRDASDPILMVNAAIYVRVP